MREFLCKLSLSFVAMNMQHVLLEQSKLMNIPVLISEMTTLRVLPINEICSSIMTIASSTDTADHTL